MNPRAGLVPIALASAFLCGLMLRLVGTIKGPLANRLGFDDRQIGRLLAVFNLAFIPMMFVGGLLVDHLGIQEMLIAGALMAALGMVALTWSGSYRGCLYAIFLIGLSSACLNAGAVVLMPRAFIETNEAASTNLGFVFFGLGALVTPGLAEILLANLGFRRTLCLAAVTCLVPGLLAIWTPSEFFHFDNPPGDIWMIFNTPAFWVAVAVFLLYCPLEGALGVWGSGFLKEVGPREGSFRPLLTGFWLSFMGSRLLVAFAQQQELLSRNSDSGLICVLALLAMVVLGNLAGAPNRKFASLGLFLVGAFLGPIVPTLVGFLFKQFPTDRGTVYGALFTFGATGSLLLPPLFSASARQRQLRRSFLLPSILSLLLAGTALVLALQ